jgi:hypothetical protein
MEGRKWSWPVVRYYSCMYSEILNKTMKNLSQDWLIHRPTMVSLFEVFYVFFINFHTLN